MTIMQASRIPLLSTHNGPSYLLHAVETLDALGVTVDNLRLVPVIGWATSPEIEPYYHHSPWLWESDALPKPLFARLGVNVRGDTRLRRFLPLVAIGLPPQSEVSRWMRENRAGSAAFHRLYARLGEVDPEWTNMETPAARLTRQLCQQFPELREPGVPLPPPSKLAWVVRDGRWERAINHYQGTTTIRPDETEDPFLCARDVVERFYTEVFLALASAEMMAGFCYRLPIEPEGRAIDVVIDDHADLREVARWLQTYPHQHPEPPRYPERDAREQQEWDDYFARCPDHDNIFETAPRLWTEQDPAIIALFGDVRRKFAQGRTDPLTPEEMLSLARRHLPDYQPDYPRQFMVTGGMNQEGMLITLMEHWLEQGPFLGMALEDWKLFTTTEQFMLCSLLLERRHMLDQCTLFETALRLLIDTRVETALETFQLQPVRLGGPLAQPGRTLALNGVAALHAPEMVVSLPFDRTEDHRAILIEKKLKLIARLFLPVHIPMQIVWKVDRPFLGKSAWMRRRTAPESVPGSRLSG